MMALFYSVERCLIVETLTRKIVLSWLFLEWMWWMVGVGGYWLRALVDFCFCIGFGEIWLTPSWGGQ